MLAVQNLLVGSLRNDTDGVLGANPMIGILSEPEKKTNTSSTPQPYFPSVLEEYTHFVCLHYSA